MTHFNHKGGSKLHLWYQIPAAGLPVSQFLLKLLWPPSASLNGRALRTLSVNQETLGHLLLCVNARRWVQSESLQQPETQVESPPAAASLTLICSRLISVFTPQPVTQEISLFSPGGAAGFTSIKGLKSSECCRCSLQPLL